MEIYQISGCSDALKTWVQNLFTENDIDYHLNKMSDGWCFDIEQTKKCIWETTFLERLAVSNLGDSDKQFLLSVF